MNWAQLIVGIMGVVLATVIYSWQKRQERHNALASDRKDSYLRFVEAAQVFTKSWVTENERGLIEAHSKLVNSVDELFLIAPTKICELAQEFRMQSHAFLEPKVGNGLSDKHREATDTLREAMKEMRIDILTTSSPSLSKKNREKEVNWTSDITQDQTDEERK